MTTAQEIARALECGRSGCPCGRRAGKGRVTHCPAHDDANPSLSLSDGGNGKVLVTCHAACSQDAVIDALRARGLWPSAPTNGSRPRQGKATRYEVKDVDGRVVAVHVRQDSASGKVMWWEMPDGRKGLSGGSPAALPLYGIDELTGDGAIMVTEGEKARDALARRGITSVGTVTGAASTPSEDTLAPLLGRRVVVWPDNDDPGRQHMERIAERLRALGHRDVRILEWPAAPPGGDAADFPGDDAALQRLLAAARSYEPPLPVDLAALLDGVRAFTRQYIVMDDAQADFVALWTAHTHVLDAAETTPYLSITSPEKRSGKSRTLEALSLLVARPWLTGRVSAAVLVRKIAAHAVTLLLDESDAAFKGEKEYAETLRAVLNAGYRRGGVASLCVKAGGDFDLRDFSVFGPKAIAGIGRLPDTIADRAIPIVLKRKAPSENAARFKWRVAQEQAAPLRDRLERWAAGALETLRDAEPTIPDELDDRAADVWEPLCAIGDAAGGEWPQRARKAALALSLGDAREDDSLGVRLLRDIRAAFDERSVDKVTCAELVGALVAMEEAPWGDLKGKALDTRRLGWRLRPFGIRSRTIRLDNGSTPKGYLREMFVDEWARYLPPVPLEKHTQPTQPTQRPDSNTRDVAVVTDVSVSPGVGRQEACSVCGSAKIDGYTVIGDGAGEPRCFAHFVRPTDGHLVRIAVEQLGLPILGRDAGKP
jgi:hypothetical protein